MATEVAEGIETPKKVDRYGFFEEEDARKPKIDVRLENQRLKKWLDMLKNWKIYKNEKSNVLKRRIRKGIPDALRGRVWSLLLSADICCNLYSNSYEDLITAHPSIEKDDITRQGGVIDRDINRTYPNHESFESIEGIGQATLKRILMAFADYDTNVKYTQGMNYIVGLLMNYMTEEECFWSLRQLMENTPFLMSQWFGQNLTMVHISHYQIQKLLDKHLPALSAHLTEIGISPAMYCTEWFMCVYARSFPYDVVVRIWDIFLAEGWTIVFQVGLALLKLYEKEIRDNDFEGAYAVISGIHDDKKLPDADVIIKTALKFNVTQEELQKYRLEYEKTQWKKVQLD